jgi:hypothetical protein
MNEISNPKSLSAENHRVGWLKLLKEEDLNLVSFTIYNFELILIY